MRKYILFGLPIVGVVLSFVLCRLEGTEFLSKESWQIRVPAVTDLDHSFLLRPVFVVGSSILLAILLVIFLRPLVLLTRFTARCLVFALLVGALGVAIAYVGMLVNGRSADFLARESWNYRRVDALLLVLEGRTAIASISQETLLQPVTLAVCGAVLGILIGFMYSICWFVCRQLKESRRKDDLKDDLIVKNVIPCYFDGCAEFASKSMKFTYTVHGDIAIYSYRGDACLCRVHYDLLRKWYRWVGWHRYPRVLIRLILQLSTMIFLLAWVSGAAGWFTFDWFTGELWLDRLPEKVLDGVPANVRDWLSDKRHWAVVNFGTAAAILLVPLPLLALSVLLEHWTAKRLFGRAPRRKFVYRLKVPRPREQWGLDYF